MVDLYKKNSAESLCVRYEPVSAANPALNRSLGGIWPSSSDEQGSGDEEGLCFRTSMQCLGGAQYARQQWLVDGPSVRARVTESAGLNLRWRQTDEFLFAAVTLDSDALEARSHAAYQALLGVLRAQRKPHLLRIWNFVPGINEPDGATERYQLFNSGRRKAFGEAGYTLSDGAPAACALGTHAGGFGVAVLAGTRPATAIENPRQISSYHYPRQYGVDAPIFSRAAWLPQSGAPDLLFVSGTASIVGHQTLHPGDTLAQLEETVRNIDALLHSANQRAGTTAWQRQDLQGRVYIRHAADYPLVSAYLREQGMTRFCHLQADICRSDLLVEIEAEGQALHAA